MALEAYEVALIKGMLKRGDRQSDIASYFGGENSGRISEINTGKKWVEVSEAPPDKLPPQGPYMAARSALKYKETLLALRDLINESLSDIEKWELRSSED